MPAARWRHAGLSEELEPSWWPAIINADRIAESEAEGSASIWYSGRRAAT